MTASTAPRVSIELDVAGAFRELVLATHSFRQAWASRLGINYIDTVAMSYLAISRVLQAGELAVQLGVSAGTMTAVLDRLEHAGLINRDRSEADRRALDISLTELGNRVVVQTQAGLTRMSKAAEVPAEVLMAAMVRMRDAMIVEVSKVADAEIVALS
jgi:DNA-binding MarR family transcriptional regulator